MANKEKLKNCAHCGSGAINRYYTGDDKLFMIACEDCPAGVESYDLTEPELIEAWNKRVKEDLG